LHLQVPFQVEPLGEIPGYRLIDKIGEGGTGEVYRATQLNLERTVAIKFLNPRADDPATLSTFHRESRLMAALSHPHVVTIHDCSQLEGRPFLIIEYVAGSTLRARLKPGEPWTIAQAAPVLEAIARALSYIHEQGVLHLDLKPENVLCTEHGVIKITDFGLASPNVDARKLAELGVAQGTVDYCSPEQRYGLPLDQRSDVFSLATLAYELLTGHLPGRVYLPASSHNPNLPSAVDEAIRRGLARDPDERFASVEELRQALDRAMQWSKPRSKAWLIAQAAALFMAALTFARLWPVRHDEAPPDPSEPSLNNISTADDGPAPRQQQRLYGDKKGLGQ